MKILPDSLKRLDKPYPFYSFLAAHSLLIGLLPFYLPVYLWGHQFGLADVTLMISATGFGFVSSLGPWQRAAKSLSVRDLFTRTFWFEFFLVSVLLAWPLVAATADLAGTAPPHFLAAIVIGLCSGAYNAWFWTTQRTLFLAMTETTNTGRQYGNFQIFVTVFLKSGILVGGLLLDMPYGLWGLIGLTLLVYLGMTTWYRRSLSEEKLNINAGKSVSLRSSFQFRDRFRSFPVFLLDGLFLFLESHFWLLSLFLVIQEDYSSLGLMVVALALFFAVSFWLLKNTIDRFKGNVVYLMATLLYAASWILRAYVDADLSNTFLLIALMFITFGSSFFRLAFNKRFFDLARHSNGTDYLLVKSYLSQCILSGFYLLLALTLFQLDKSATEMLPVLYTCAAAASLGYLLYRKPNSEPRSAQASAN